MTVSELCNREVVIAQRGLSVAAATRLMRQFHVGDIVAVEDIEGGRRPREQPAAMRPAKTKGR